MLSTCRKCSRIYYQFDVVGGSIRSVEIVLVAVPLKSLQGNSIHSAFQRKVFYLFSAKALWRAPMANTKSHIAYPLRTAVKLLTNLLGEQLVFSSMESFVYVAVPVGLEDQFTVLLRLTGRVFLVLRPPPKIMSLLAFYDSR